MKITEQETDCLIRILLDKIQGHEAEVDKLTEELREKNSVAQEMFVISEADRDEKLKWQRSYDELQKKYDELQKKCDELQKKAEGPSSLGAWFNLELHNTHYDIPEHGQICLCLTTKMGCVSRPEDFVVLRYNDTKKCWQDRNGGDDKVICVYKYNDYNVTWWVGIEKFFMQLTGNN